jgi:hypothetical protein
MTAKIPVASVPEKIDPTDGIGGIKLLENSGKSVNDKCKIIATP